MNGAPGGAYRWPKIALVAPNLVFHEAGQNLVGLAPCIADARALRMVLLGGRTGAEVEGHDWEYPLTQLGVTHLDRGIGMTAYAIGLVIMTASLISAGRETARDSE